MDLLLTQSFDTCVDCEYVVVVIYLSEKVFAQNCWGMLRVLEAPKMPPTCSVKQANQNELEIMCRCGMWHAKLEASYVYNTGTHSYITSLITGRTHLTSLERVQISLRVLWQCFVVVCLAGCVTILMKVQKLCKTNNMNNCKSSRKALCQCVPIQLNENCTCLCTNRTKRTVLM